MAHDNLHNVSFKEMRLYHMFDWHDHDSHVGFPTEINQAALEHENYKLTLKSNVIVNREPAVLTRMERLDGVNNGLFGEHISTLIRPNGKWLGYVDMNADDADGPLPTTERAQRVATDLLTHIAPDLLPERDILWTKPHSETIYITASPSGPTQKQGQKLEITGIKVKSRNPNDGLYHWVIVGPHDRVIVFERDIKWIKFPGKRGTEKWLHDAWLSKQNQLQ